jgi:predicted nucleotidyltransferase
MPNYFTKDEEVLLKSLGVRALILFGSRAQELARDDSDFDFAVIGPSTKAVYNQLYDLLSAKINKLVNIDIVFLDNSPMELNMHVVKYGKLLFEDSPGVFADFKQNTMLIYADFAPYRREFQQATLNRI